MRNAILTIFFFSLNMYVFAQQDPQYTQYMYNTANINPAYAGSRGVLSIFGLHRSQWIGMDGAPTTNSFSAHTPLGGSNLGIGTSFINDKIGPTIENNIALDLSYTLKLSNKFKLAFGIKGTLNVLDVDFFRLNIYNQGDPRFQNNIENKINPNVGGGLYLFSEKSYIGISIPNFIETKHYDDNVYSTATEKPHFHFIAGYVFDLSDNLNFKPATMLKTVSGSPIQLDISGNFWINQKFTIGAAYRLDAAVSGLAGLQVSKQLFVGYAYDAETTRLANYNSGSHEIFIRYEFFKNVNKVITPRFF